MKNKPLLKVENLTVSFDQIHPIIENVTFDVHKYDFLAVVGPNGAGKTVLIKAILDYLPYSGNITWEENIHIGYVPQSIDLDRYLTLTLKDFLMLKIKILKLPASETLANICKLTNIDKSLLKNRLSLLSGGQRQKGFIAFALIGEPDIIFLDEPTANIDETGEAKIYKELKAIQKEKNIAIVLISHELDLVSKYTTKVLCLNRQMLCFGKTQTALTPDVMKSLYGSRHHFHSFEENYNHKHNR